MKTLGGKTTTGRLKYGSSNYYNYNRRIRSWAKKNDIDIQTLDYRAGFDEKLNTNENYDNFVENNKVLEKHDDIETIKDTIEENEIKFQEYLRSVEQEAREKETEAIQTILSTKDKDLDKYYVQLKCLMRSLVQGNINGLMVLGEAGLGKTYQVNKILQEFDKKPNEDFAILSSYATPLEFYKFLYHNNDKIVILDDLLKLLDNDIAKGILFAGLWSISEDSPRIINYHSSTGKLKVPKSFEFKGKIIWCLNKLPSELEPLMSRIFKYEMKFNYSEKLEMVAHLCNVLKIPQEVFDFIKKNTDKATPNLNLRLPIVINEIRKHSGGDWKKISLKQIEVNPHLQLVKELQEEVRSEKEKIEVFISETGMSRASYFRFRQKLDTSTSAKHSV